MSRKKGSLEIITDKAAIATSIAAAYIITKEPSIIVGMAGTIFASYYELKESIIEGGKPSLKRFSLITAAAWITAGLIYNNQNESESVIKEISNSYL